MNTPTPNYKHSRTEFDVNALLKTDNGQQHFSKTFRSEEEAREFLKLIKGSPNFIHPRLVKFCYYLTTETLAS